MKLLRPALTFVLVLAFLAAPLAAEAQQAKKVYKVGWLSAHPDLWGGFRWAFLRGLLDRGWVLGENLVFEWRQPGGVTDRELARLPDFATELVQLKMDVIVAWGTRPTHAITSATKGIPVVFVSVADPVASGFVASRARPGGNVTGVRNMAPEIVGKQLELLKETVPGLSRVAVLWDPADPAGALIFPQTWTAAEAWGLRLQSREVRSSGDFPAAFAAMKRDNAQALVVLESFMMVPYRSWIARVALDYRLPVISNSYYLTEAGGLISYRTDDYELLGRAAALTDKILKGGNPADLSVEQPTKFELAVNMKTAKALGLTIPPFVLVGADKVIE